MDKEQDIEKLHAEIKRLRELIGSWKRKAEGKESKPRRIFKESYRQNGDQLSHIKTYIIDYIPGDLSAEQALNEIVTSGILRQNEPYRFHGLAYTVKYDAWILELKNTVIHDNLEKYWEYYDIRERKRHMKEYEDNMRKNKLSEI